MKNYQALSLLITLVILTVRAQEPLMQPRQFDFHDFIKKEKRITGELIALTPDEGRQHPEFGENPFNTPCEGCFELVHKRQIDERFFVKEGTRGKHFFVQKSSIPLHYPDSIGFWRTIDHHLYPVDGNPGLFMAADQPIPVGIDLKRPATIIQAGELNFKFNSSLQLQYASDGHVIQSLNADFTNTTVGRDGSYTTGIWPGIDMEQIVQRGAVKVNFIIREKPAFPAGAKWMIISDEIVLPPDYVLKYDLSAGIFDENGFKGALKVKQRGSYTYINWSKPAYYNLLTTHGMYGSYRVKELETGLNSNRFTLEMLVPVAWLNQPGMEYPVVLDPLVSGADTIGMFKYYASALPPPPDQYYSNHLFTTASLGSCDYVLTVKVPGMSQLIRTLIDLEYRMPNDPNCDPSIIPPACKFSDVTMEVEGPCGISTGQLACNPPQPPLVGWCTTDPMSVPGAGPLPFPGPGFPIDLLSCIPPQCPDYILNFTLKNREYVCIPDTCHGKCARGNIFAITVEARTIENYLQLTAGDTLICPGDTVQITAFPSWGVPPYHYQWTPGNLTGKTITVTPFDTTTYVVTAYDTCGNPDFEPDSITIYTIPAPPVDAGEDTTLCAGSAVQLGGNPTSPSLAPVTWTSQPAWAVNFLSSSNVFNPVLQLPADSTGTFYFFVRAHGQLCDNIDVVSVTVKPLPVVSVTPAGPVEICPGETVELSAPPGFFTYTWSNGSTGQQTLVSDEGSYQLTVTDAFGCTATSNSVTVSLKPLPFIEVLPEDTTIFRENSVSIRLITDTGMIDNFYWLPDPTLSCLDCLNPVAVPENDAVYTVVVEYANCRLEDSARVNVIVPIPYSIPSAFSPNHDGVNDIFRVIFEEEVQILEFKVFNRWGEKVYDNPAGKWDGTFRDEPQPIGVYTYMIKLKLEDGRTVVESGNVTLIR